MFASCNFDRTLHWVARAIFHGLDYFVKDFKQ
jgi:hypothetical protein